MSSSDNQVLSDCCKALAGSIKVIVVDDDSNCRDGFCEVLETVPIFKVCSASTARQAHETLRQSTDISCVTLDLGMNDCEQDEFFLLRKYVKRVSFVILTGSPSAETGAKCIKNGARAVLSKPVLSKRLLDEVFKWALITKLNPLYNNGAVTAYDTSLDCLLSARPLTNSAWSEMVGVDCSYLRRLWSQEARSARHALVFSHVMLCSYDFLLTETVPQSFSTNLAAEFLSSASLYADLFNLQ